jgi:trimeric autotransporter adhesin
VAPPDTTCSNFALIATVGPRNATGNVTYLDTTVAWGTSYRYRVAAFNAANPPTGTTPLVYVTLTTPVAFPVLPTAPTGFTVTLGAKQGNNYPATLSWTAPSTGAPANYTIQQANNLAFTTGLNTFTAAASPLTQNIKVGTVYYYRIRANNSLGGSSAWTNAVPFPIAP